MSQASIVAFEATVVAVDELSPSFLRITLGGEGMANFGIPGHPRDMRFKLIIPADGGAEPSFDLLTFLAEQEGSDLSWYQAWLQVDPEVRGFMRTYTVREWRDAQRELVVDMVLHTDADGHSGPAAAWAKNARIGHRLHLIGRSRYAEADYGGIEFAPGDARQLLIAGDETAVPAIASILDSIKDSDIRGRALLEVPDAADILDLDAPAGFEVQWLPRNGADFGEVLEPAVRAAVRTEAKVLAEVGAGSGAAARSGDVRQTVDLEDVDIDAEILWDVPTALTQAAQGSTSDTDEDARPFYAWIAGEAGPVKRLRRYLVQEVGVDRKQVAFMGYWRQGRAES